ncbi:glutathione synthetase [Fopius arisanus]|uniref:Glutathione synthetase n=1 Tax=Fopius arisanus TaxID=64838 RepID=A0A9R1TUJ0_9HYME|nr:PREDICTED: glutathione synthetase-like [Fopius arisanus]XP_011315520.1 PREDICTED: glutathione synthetase-like [Fopius arisanus]
MEMTKLNSCVDVPLTGGILEETVDKAKDFALMHGMCMHWKENFDRNRVQVAKFMLLPTTFPTNEFSKAQNIQVLVNKLIHKVSCDHDFLTEALKSTIETDELTSELFKIYKTVHQEGFAQKISLGLLRSDYMLDNDSKIKQVEVNTMASSFAGLSEVVTELQKYILGELGHFDKTVNLPENHSATGLAEGLVDAWKAYNNQEAVILFVVEEITCNICDQKALEIGIRRRNPRIRVIRRTFKYLIENAQLRPNKELIVENNLVSVVYYRTGYETSAYPTDREWELRLLIERSRAIKCPSIQYHLAGTKKVQQVLAQPGVLRRFLCESEVSKVQDAFVGLYSLDFDKLGDEAMEMGLANPEKYVLKPQREGGGNNVYGLDVKSKLEAMRNSKERTAWILMELIKTPIHRNYLISPNIPKPSLQDFVSELGIYGVILGDDNEIRVNKQVGHVIRTKPLGEDEGGIIAGAGALDSPYLL